MAKSAFMNLDAIIRSVQRELGVGVDGKAGPQTWQAIHARVCGSQADDAPPPKLPAGTYQKVDERSERTIATLQPQVQPYARALVLKAASIGITIKVISGLRTYDEQNALYAKGRTKPGNVVTNARGGYSNHNFGIAFDIGVFKGTSYIPESPQYKAVGAIGTDLGLEWGGNWTSIRDEPHFQLRPAWATGGTEREMLAGLRSRKSSGKEAYV